MSAIVRVLKQAQKAGYAVPMPTMKDLIDYRISEVKKELKHLQQYRKIFA